MGKEIGVIVGEKIPLNAQEGFKDGTKIILATVIDLATGSTIATGLQLNHIGGGTYRNTALSMPAGSGHLFARYDVFESDGITPNKTGPFAVSDIFVPINDTGAGDQAVLNKLDQVISIVTSHDLNSQLLGFVNEDADLVGTVMPEDAIGVVYNEYEPIGVVLTADLTGGNIDDEEIIGSI